MTADLEHFRNLYGRVGDAYGLMTAGGPIAVRKPLTDDHFRAHREGRERIGTYFLDPEGITDQLVFDDDENRPELVKRLLIILGELGIEAYPETSKSKGFHVRTHWEPAPAADLRRIGAYIARRAGVPDIEVFPKQDRRGPLRSRMEIFGILKDAGWDLPGGEVGSEIGQQDPGITIESYVGKGELVQKLGSVQDNAAVVLMDNMNQINLHTIAVNGSTPGLVPGKFLRIIVGPRPPG